MNRSTRPLLERFVPLLYCVAVMLLAAKLPAQEKAAPARTLQSGGRERAYHLYVPATLERTKPAPVLLIFHGAGGNGASDLGAYRWLADRHGFILVGPDGVNKRWNAGNRDEVTATDKVDDVAFVRDLLKAIAAGHNVDTNRLYAAGFSNGAALCHRLAAEMPEVFAAVAGAGATMSKVTLPLLKPGASVAVQIMVGTEDGMFGRKGDLRGGTFLTAEAAAEVWAKHNGCSEPVKHDAPVPFTRWPAKSPATAEVELWIVEGAGHTPSLGGKAWSASEQQWKFLERHARSAPGFGTAWPFSADEAKRRQTEAAALFALPVEQSVELPGAGAGYGNDSPKDHIVYGGTYRAESGGNGARLANIMISDKPEGARFALIREESSVPKGHPETHQEPK